MLCGDKLQDGPERGGGTYHIIKLFERISNTLFKKYRTNPAFKQLVAPYGEEGEGVRNSSASFSLKMPTSTRISNFPENVESKKKKKKDCCQN